jgi:hypothetical protein
VYPLETEEVTAAQPLAAFELAQTVGNAAVIPKFSENSVVCANIFASKERKNKSKMC